MSRSSKPARWEHVVWPLLALAVLLMVWHFAVAWSGTKVFPPASRVWRGVLEIAHKGLLWRDIVDSLWRVGAGFGLAVLVGVPMGLVLGWFRPSAQIVNPTLEMLRPISPLAWIPLAIVFFGVGNKPAVFLIFLGALFPIVVACMNGVATVPVVFRQAGRNFGLSSAELVRRVVLPASLPQILVGLRLAFGVAWLVVVAAEMVAVNSGLGYLVIDSRNAGNRYDLVVAAMLLIGVLGLALDSVFRQCERLRWVRWGFRRER